MTTLSSQGAVPQVDNPSVMGTLPIAQSVGTGAVDITYEQSMLTGNGGPTQEFEAGFSAYDCEAADDFVIPPGGSRSIISVQPTFTGSIVGDITMRVYDDATGIPGNLVFSEVFPGTDYPLLTSVNCPVLSPGTYWLSLQVDQDFGSFGQIFWSTTTDSDAGPNPWVWRNPGGGFGVGCIDWDVSTTCGIAGGTGPGLAMIINISEVAAGIPTLSQWGLIIVSLSMLIFGIVVIKRRSVLMGSA